MSGTDVLAKNLKSYILSTLQNFLTIREHYGEDQTMAKSSVMFNQS